MLTKQLKLRQFAKTQIELYSAKTVKATTTYVAVVTGKRAVLNAGEHLSVTCDKPKDTKPKCVNCSGNHTANFRGCIIAKELQKRRNEITKDRKKADFRSKLIVKKRQAEWEKLSKGNPTILEENKTSTIPTYAEKTAQRSSKTNNAFSVRGIDKILEVLDKLISRLDQHEKFNKMKFDMIENELSIIKNK